MELFYSLLRYHLLDTREAEIDQLIQCGLEEKLDKMVKHELYSAYKTADTTEERERARLDYLNKIGMHLDFRW